MKPQFIVEQKITLFGNKYSIFAVGQNNEKAGLLAFAKQKKIAMKEKITFYSDTSQSTPVFLLRAEKVMDIHGRYLVEDGNGNPIGAFKKEFIQSLARSTWSILDGNDQPAITVQESNPTLAAIRRYGAMVPIVGGVIELVTDFIKYHFDFVDTRTNQPIGRYEKTTLFKDHYAFSVSEEAYQQTDWRVFASVAVALDALQSR